MLKFNLGGKHFEFSPKLLVMAGFTGRNRAAIQAHIDELAANGIASTSTFPAYYHKLADRITQAETLEALDSSDHTGEGEYCVFRHEGRFYLTPGSDHTDRKAEVHNVLKSKQIYPSIVGREVWAYEEVKDHWNQVELKSWATVNGERRLYQRFAMADLLSPPELMDWFKIKLTDPGEMEGVMIFSGTMAGLFTLNYAEKFEVSLEDPVLRRELRSAYTLRSVADAYLNGRAEI